MRVTTKCRRASVSAFLIERLLGAGVEAARVSRHSGLLTAIENTDVVQIAEGLGIRSILHEITGPHTRNGLLRIALML